MARNLEIPCLSSRQARGPAAARRLRLGPVSISSAARSKIWSPIATPPRGRSFEPLRRKTPNGRFWIGKSLAGSLADSTQLFSSGSWVAFEAIPDFVVALLQRLRLQRGARWTEDVTRLPHEREGVADLFWNQAFFDVFLVGRDIWPVGAHAVVDRDAARREALRLGVVHAAHQPHQLAHHVAVEPGRAEGVL